MKSLVAAVVIVLIASSAATAGWTYVAPVGVPMYSPVGHQYYTASPVYVYRLPMVPAPVVTAPAQSFYLAPVVVRQKVFVHGQPVRNVLRALRW